MHLYHQSVFATTDRAIASGQLGEIGGDGKLNCTTVAGALIGLLGAGGHEVVLSGGRIIGKWQCWGQSYQVPSWARRSGEAFCNFDGKPWNLTFDLAYTTNNRSEICTEIQLVSREMWNVRPAPKNSTCPPKCTFLVWHDAFPYLQVAICKQNTKCELGLQLNLFGVIIDPKFCNCFHIHFLQALSIANHKVSP